MSDASSLPGPTASLTEGAAPPAGQTLTFALSLDAPVALLGAATPFLTLAGGGTAVLDAAASTSGTLVFGHVVAPGEDAAALSATALDLAGDSLVAGPDLGAATPLELGAAPGALAVASGAGAPVLLVADTVANRLLSFGLGDGAPGGATALGAADTGAAPVAVAVGGAGADGTRLVATADAGADGVSLFALGADGSLSALGTMATGSGPQALALGDVTGDGVPDLVVADAGDGTVDVLTGTGIAGAPLAAGPVVTVGGAPDAVALLPVAGQAAADVVVADGGSAGGAGGTVSVLAPTPGGGLGVLATYAVGNDPVALAVADLDGDGIPDLVVANQLDDTLTVLLGRGDGTFRPGATLPTGVLPDAVAVADLNGDGHPDLVVADEGGQDVSVLPGAGDGGFGAAETDALALNPTALVVAAGADGPLLVVGDAVDAQTAVLHAATVATPAAIAAAITAGTGLAVLHDGAAGADSGGAPGGRTGAARLGAAARFRAAPRAGPEPAGPEPARGTARAEPPSRGRAAPWAAPTRWPRTARWPRR